MSRRTLVLLPLLMIPIIVGGIVAGIAFLTPLVLSTPALRAPATNNPFDAPVRNASQPVPTLTLDQTAEFDAEDRLLTALYEQRSPAVVAIRVQGRHPDISGLPFNLPQPDQSPAPGDQSPELPELPFEAAGSGFLIDDQGHIVTNNHVVEDATLIEIAWPSGLVVEGRVVGTDPDSDLAVLQVERVPEGVQPLPLGDSSQVRVGQRAIAIGNPFSLNTTLTVGVVSARGRTVANREAAGGGFYSIADVIQTDAAINPGNSGGPLFNSRGEVIGVNTAIRSESGVFEGVGFAIPSNTVRKVVKALIETGRYEHPFLGISFFSYPVTAIVARELKLPVDHGVFVVDVVDGGPADRAGLRASDKTVTINGIEYPAESDIVLKIDDREVYRSDDIIDYLATSTEVGQKVTLTILRDGQQQTLEVTLGARPRN